MTEKLKLFHLKESKKKDFRFGFFFLDFTRAFDVSYVIRNFNFSYNCNLFSVQNMKQKQIKKAEKNEFYLYICEGFVDEKPNRYHFPSFLFNKFILYSEKYKLNNKYLKDKK